MSAVGSAAWRVLGVGSGVAATKTARTVAEKVWKATVGGEPPRNPASYDTTWPEALAWALAVGAATGVARLLATRAAASVYRVGAGHLPKGLEDVGN